MIGGRWCPRGLRVGLAAVALAATLAGCSVGGTAVPVGSGGGGNQQGNVNTDQFDKLTLECQMVPALQIAKIVGGDSAQGTFNGAICRWIVGGAVSANVTFNWFEWGSLTAEKDTAKKLGYTTENVKVASQAAFTQRDPKRPAVCGVTTRAPSGGVYTWWVEPRGATASDPCTAPTKLMELLLHGGQ